jgi:glycosyltransferase involved in cell wall biosynthesis
MEMLNPKLSVVIPCRNEIGFIERCLRSVFAAEQIRGGSEVIVVDGMSEDGTREILSSFQKMHHNLIVLNNPRRTVPSAMNIGIKFARGRWIIRLDSHSEYPKDYFQSCIKTAERTGDDNVGGIVTTLQNGTSFGAKCVQAITTHRFGVGNSRFRLGSKEGLADTVAYGCFRKEIFNKIGFYDERLLRNQDFELNQRIIKAGGKIWLNPNIKIHYYNQSSLKGLFRQAFFTGSWNSWMWYLASYSFKLRHAIPAFFVLGLLIILVISLFHKIGLFFLSIITIPYLFLNIIAIYQQLKRFGWKLSLALFFLFPSYHICYGSGILFGLAKLLVRKSPVQKKEGTLA